MKLRAWVVFGAVGLMLAGCGSDAQPGAAAAPTGSAALATAAPTTAAQTTAAPTTAAPTSTPKPKPAPPPRQASSAELRRALLGKADLPAGFTLGPDPAGDVGQNPTYRSTSPACAKAINTLYNELPPARAAVRYTKEYPTGRQQVRVVLEELGSWPGGGAAREMEAVGKAPARCPTWNFADSQYGTVPIRATPLKISKIGEEVYAYTIVTHWAGRGDTHELLIFIRSDTRRMLFNYFAPVGRQIDYTECYKILGAAIHKLPNWHQG